jgi:tetratricopeptide (TPR) repeat protein
MLEALVDDLVVRIGVWREWRDPRPILDPRAADQVGRIEELLHQSADTVLQVRAVHAVGWFYWCSVQARPENGEQRLYKAMTSFTWLWNETPEDIARELVPAELVEALAEGGAVPPPPEAAGAVARMILEDALGSTDPTALDRATAQLAVLAERITREHPYYPLCLACSSILLRTKHKRTDDPVDLDEAIRLARAALASPVIPVLRAPCLSALGNALLTRSGLGVEPAGAAEAVDVLRQALRATEELDDSDVATPLVALTAALARHAELTGIAGDHADAVQVGERALRHAPSGTEQHFAATNNLVLALRGLALRTGDGAAMDRATELLRQLARHPDVDNARVLDMLSAQLVETFLRGGSPALLEEAVRAARRALAAASAAEWLGVAHGFLTALQTHLDNSGDRGVLDEVVTVARQVVELHPADRQRAAALSALSVALRSRFEYSNTPDDLADAVRFGRESVEVADSDVVGGCLSNLALALKARYHLRDTIVDLDEAIECGRRATTDTAGRYRSGAMHTLAVGLFERYTRFEDQAALDEAIAVATESLRASSAESPRWALAASLLATLLRHRSTREGSRGDHERAVELARESLARTPDAHPDRWRRLHTLANILHTNARNTGSAAEMAESIAVTRQALELVPAGVERSRAMLNLGLQLWKLVELDETDDQARLEATALCQEVLGLPSAPTSIRMQAARNWAAGAAKHSGNPADALEPLSAMVDLLPLLAWRGMDRATQERVLGDHPGLCSWAASAAIAAGRPAEAVELLEQSRALLWSLQRQHQADLAPLREIAPHLADELDRIRHGFADVPDTPADRRVALASRWDDAVAEVRRLPGFENFPRIATEDPRLAAAGGPVAMINVEHGGWGSHALLVTDKDIDVIPLPVAPAEVLARIGDYAGALDEVEREPGIVSRRNLERVLAETLEWLWDSVAGPVLTALGHDRPPPDGGPWPRLWWCPIGVMTMLPLHAAGYHGPEGAGRTVVDRVISSYTPTLSALIASRRARAAATDPDQGRMLVIGVPEVDDAPALPGVTKDTDMLAALFGPTRRTLLDGPAATVDNVLRAAPEHRWLHVGCHGGWNMRTPTLGGLRLRDGMLTIADLTDLRSAAGEFAFVGACQTAIPSIALPDEAISFASALHHGGYCQVIGTLWAVGDLTTSRIVHEVYGRLVRDQRLFPELAARALHDAVRRVRDQAPHLPSRWAHFIHLGS